MSLRHWMITSFLGGLLLAGCGSIPGQVPATLIPAETPGPLQKVAYYWDMGISVKYPNDWVDPQFDSGQMILARSVEAASDATVTKPLVSFGLVDVQKLGLPNTAKLQDILSALAVGPDVQVREANAVYVAGLDAAYMALTDTKTLVNGFALTFRLPDGRVGSMIAIAPTTIWAYDFPTFEAIRQSTRLIKPTEFVAPVPGTETAVYPTGGITFTQPKGWTARDFMGARLYHEANLPEYVDNSGFANGPHLTIAAKSLPQNLSVRDAMTQTISMLPSDKVSDITVGSQPAVQIASSDAATGQAITFVGFTSTDRTVLMIFRWTTPGILAEVARPAFDALLNSVRFGPIVAPLQLRPQVAATPTPH
ncbi:MAG: hypothetical protein ABI947_14800 [Chloroflexota bacterium]